MEPKQEKKKLINRLKSKYRLVLLNASTYEERYSIQLTPLNVITSLGLMFFLVTVIVVLSIVLSPLKQYIPGYSDSETKIAAYNASFMADSLQQQMSLRQNYINNLRDILNGNIKADSSNMIKSEPTKYKDLDFKASKEDSLLRIKVEENEKFNVTFDPNTSNKNVGMAGVFFFTPLRGTVTSSFNLRGNHLGIDIAGPKNEPIKAVLDGTVVFSSFTTDAGYVIHLQHANNLISVYKHNSVVLKKVGDTIKAGDSIAIIGNSGELTDGPHLHFELWQKGQAINPEDFIVFN
jgi:murein DD-endopeptidase MepM/ murein hydrolase activator NlpD